MLDVGCGTGNILEFFLDRERAVGLDVGPEFIDEARARFGDRTNFRAEVGDISDPACAQLLTGERFDTVICVNTLEHIEDDALSLSNMFGLLPPGGRVVLFVPALPALHGSMDEVDGHHRRYTKATLGAALTAAGFDIEHMHYMNLPGMIAWFIDGRILKRRFVPPSHDGLFQRLVPKIAALEKKLRPPVGLSLLAVGRRGA